MSNHPNRNWRARMSASLSDWLGTALACCLIEVPIDPAKSREAMEYRIAQAFKAGYTARKNEER